MNARPAGRRPGCAEGLRPPPGALVLLAAALLALTRGGDLAARTLANGGAILLAQEAVAGKPPAPLAGTLFAGAAAWRLPHASLGRGRLAYLRGDWTEAVRYLEPYLQARPSDEVAGYFFASSLIAQGRPVDMAQLEAVAPQALAAIVQSQIQAGEWEQAAAIWLGVPHGLDTVDLPRLTKINHELTRHALDAGECDQGRALLNEVLGWRAQRPGVRPEEYFAEVQFDLGQCHLAKGDLAQAAGSFQAALARDPRYSRWAYAFLSDIASVAGDSRAARDWLGAGLELFPNDDVLTDRLASLPD